MNKKKLKFFVRKNDSFVNKNDKKNAEMKYLISSVNESSDKKL
jgi:hypothetical protein